MLRANRLLAVAFVLLSSCVCVRGVNSRAIPLAPEEKLERKNSIKHEMQYILDKLENINVTKDMKGASSQILDFVTTKKAIKPSVLRDRICEKQQNHCKSDDEKEEDEKSKLIKKVVKKIPKKHGDVKRSHEAVHTTGTKMSIPDVKRVDVPPEDWAGQTPMASDSFDNVVKAQEAMEDVVHIRNILDGYTKSVLPIAVQELNKTITKKELVQEALRLAKKEKEGIEAKGREEEEKAKQKMRKDKEVIGAMQKAQHDSNRVLKEISDLTKAGKDAAPQAEWRATELLNLWKNLLKARPRVMIAKCPKIKSPKQESQDKDKKLKKKLEHEVNKQITNIAINIAQEKVRKQLEARRCRSLQLCPASLLPCASHCLGHIRGVWKGVREGVKAHVDLSRNLVSGMQYYANYGKSPRNGGKNSAKSMNSPNSLLQNSALEMSYDPMYPQYSSQNSLSSSPKWHPAQVQLLEVTSNATATTAHTHTQQQHLEIAVDMMRPDNFADRVDKDCTECCIA